MGALVPTYKMTLAYDGTEYRGWQVQPGDHTIQGRLEAALARMAGTGVAVIGAGRTDAGVHALGQVAHFELERPIPEEGILRGLNSMLPQDIRVLDVERASDGFHARYSARDKTYRYHLDRSPVPLPFRCRFALHYPHALDRSRLEAGAALVAGEHDFAGFRAASCEARTTTRRVSASRFFDEGTELVYEVSANGFLHHMVRNLVGTLLEIGRGKRGLETLGALFESGNRTEAGPTAPAKGLLLLRVDYA